MENEVDSLVKYFPFQFMHCFFSSDEFFSLQFGRYNFMKENMFFYLLLTATHVQGEIFNLFMHNLLDANPTKWSNVLKKFVGCCRRIFLSV